MAWCDVMIPALLLLLSITALVQFSLAFCRSLLFTYSKVELSERVREVSGLSGETVEAGEFSRLMNLVFLAPDPGDDAMEIRSVTLYHTLVALARWFVGGRAGISVRASVGESLASSPRLFHTLKLLRARCYPAEGVTQRE